MTEVDLKALLDATDEHVTSELERMPEVEEMGHELDVDGIPGGDGDRIWQRLTEAIAVVADLKSSTQLGLNQKSPSTASIYEAATGNVAAIYDEFDADFIAIQGDGAFALFWGDDRRSRAICASITVQTFGKTSLVPKLTNKWENLPPTGLKVGIAHSPLLVRRIGIVGSGRQEPVWAGRAVNYAAKCAQQADAGEMIVTGTLWDWVAKNDYLAASCDCNQPPSTSELWKDVTIEKIPEVGKGKGEREGKKLVSQWCVLHGAEYCAAVLAGKRTREGVRTIVEEALKVEFSSPLRKAAQNAREAAWREVRMDEIGRKVAMHQRDHNARQAGFRKAGR